MVPIERPLAMAQIVDIADPMLTHVSHVSSGYMK